MPAEIARSMEDLKKSGQAVGARVLTNLAGFAPPTILSQAARLQARQRFFNLVVTNVPGPQFPLYLLGRKLQVLYPVVPLARRQAIGIAVMSYDGHLGFGVLGDYDAVPELESIGRDLKLSISSLLRAAAVHGARRRPAQLAQTGSPGRAPPGATPPGPKRRPPASAPARADVRLALCQLNATVGDIAGNAERIADGLTAARDAGADLVLFPELAITGYPPEDLLLKEHFLTDAAQALTDLAAQTHDIVAVVGYPERADHVYNAAAVLADGAIRAIYRKVHLPNYGVFDEHRYFTPGPGGGVIDLGSERVGLTVCEDLWEPGPPGSDEAGAGATLLLNISASPYHAGKGAEREEMFAERARANVACVAFCALVGGQDELVFDGRSCVIDHTGTVIARAAEFREDVIVCEVDVGAAATAQRERAAQRAGQPGRARRAGHRPRGVPGATRPLLRAGGGRRAAGSGAQADRARRGRGLQRAVARAP